MSDSHWARSVPVLGGGTVGISLWLFNIAMEHGPFIDDFPYFPIKTSIFFLIFQKIWMIRWSGVPWSTQVLDMPVKNWPRAVKVLDLKMVRNCWGPVFIFLSSHCGCFAISIIVESPWFLSFVAYFQMWQETYAGCASHRFALRNTAELPHIRLEAGKPSGNHLETTIRLAIDYYLIDSIDVLVLMCRKAMSLGCPSSGNFWNISTNAQGARGTNQPHCCRAGFVSGSSTWSAWLQWSQPQSSNWNQGLQLSQRKGPKLGTPELNCSFRIPNFGGQACSFLFLIQIFDPQICCPLVIEHSYGKSPFFMGKLTISMAIFNSYVDITRGWLMCPAELPPPLRRWCLPLRGRRSVGWISGSCVALPKQFEITTPLATPERSQK